MFICQKTGVCPLGDKHWNVEADRRLGVLMIEACVNKINYSDDGVAKPESRL